VILVTVGTNEARFDRIIRAVEPLAAEEELFVQHGPSPVRPEGATCVDYLPFDELVERMRTARVVVTHAGVGSVISALSAGQLPIVLPRLRRHGEAVDDHQVPFGRRLHDAGLVELVEDEDRLRRAVLDRRRAETVGVAVNDRLIADLRQLVDSLVR
jgi:UDP-N-acetylglucosamine transferase subunit ALG13